MRYFLRQELGGCGVSLAHKTLCLTHSRSSEYVSSLLGHADLSTFRPANHTFSIFAGTEEEGGQPGKRQGLEPLQLTA